LKITHSDLTMLSRLTDTENWDKFV
jgi:hypothetical protein